MYTPEELYRKKIFKQENYFSAKSQENRYFNVLISEK